MRNPFERGYTLARTTLKRAWLRRGAARLISAQAMPDPAFLALFDLEAVSAHLARGDAPAAKAALLDHYRRRTLPAWPAPSMMITDLRLDLDQLSRAEIVDRANAILDYRISYSTLKPRITPAGHIDWRFNPTSSREWLRRLNRHQWWPVLGLAYSHTGDERYAVAFVTQMLDWIVRNPPLSRKDEKSPVWRLMETGLRMSVAWIPAFALFYTSPSFTDAAKLMMLKSIYDHCRFLARFKTNRNHLLREINGLAHVSVYFPEFIDAKAWQQIALDRLECELRQQINPDGSHIEVSTGYQWLVVDELGKAYDLLRMHNLSLPNENLAARLESMYQLLAYVIRPDFRFPELNDGFLLWPNSRLARAGEVFGRADFTYVGTAGGQGDAPPQTSVAFNDGGLYVMRSDWTKEARYLIFDAGPYGGPHGHEDKLSIEVCAFGQPFVVDPGSYSYEETDPFRLYFVGSQGHNTALVDGLSQVRRWNKAHLNPQAGPGNHAVWIGQPDFDYVAASYTEGYGVFQLHRPPAAAIVNDVSHTRRILFVKPDYWLMIDELQAAALHTYQLLFHAAPEVAPCFGPEQRVVLGTTPDGPRLYLIPVDTQNLQVSSVTGSEAPIQGWYSTGHLDKVPASVVLYERKGCASTILTTLLYPCAAGQTAEEVSIAPLEVSPGDGLAFVVTTGRGRDYLLLSQNDRAKRFGPYQSSGGVAGVRTDRHGNVLGQFEWKTSR
ncbi:MAG TPA: alginate lyase family protein [Anaerolineae bacterium]|nr:alginate lyase family protein [Anaerolineae bacterium]